MKFLLDQDVYVATIRMLRDSNHDVVRVAEIGLARADDEIILARARELDRILVTRDRDFGTLVFAKHLLAYLEKPGLNIDELFRAVAESVQKEAEQQKPPFRQLPYRNSQISKAV